ncbi:hypothetical protein TNCV_721961 [Trichonephila clavipes]|nr:hypothetical protein TNCV_721961 [Trichonephila clavipes]
MATDLAAAKWFILLSLLDEGALLVEWPSATKLPHLSEANPQVYVETPLHPEKLTVWCALWAGGIIGRTSSKTMKATTITVNGDRYRGHDY